MKDFIRKNPNTISGVFSTAAVFVCFHYSLVVDLVFFIPAISSSAFHFISAGLEGAKSKRDKAEQKKIQEENISNIFDEVERLQKLAASDKQQEAVDDLFIDSVNRIKEERNARALEAKRLSDSAEASSIAKDEMYSHVLREVKNSLVDEQKNT